MNIKSILRELFIFLHLDITKNLEYDRLTNKIMKLEIKEGFNCIDIGCHKGEMLELMVKYSKTGKLYAFEPIPYMYTNLVTKFKNKATIFPYALSNKNDFSTFNYVKNAPAYSGINKRKYDVKNPEIEEIKVELKPLDEVISLDIQIDFVKIDVEGGEFDVIKGAKETFKKWKPIIVFESGLGASDYYGTKPANLYTFITEEIGLKISTLKSFVKKESVLSLSEFVSSFNNNTEYYFIAHK